METNTTGTLTPPTNLATDTGIVNRVAQSALITLNLEDLRNPATRVLLDIKDQLFQGLILREKDFREFVKNHDWAQYAGKAVAITCTADAVVPTWAYMLLGTALAPHATHFVFGSLQDLEIDLYRRALEQHDFAQYRGEKVVLKGCGTVPPATYVDAVRKLMPFADKLMYGEPCSTVPLYKKPAAKA
jgi:hypothetical protein